MNLGVLVPWWSRLRQTLRRLRGGPSANEQRLARIEQRLDELRRDLATPHSTPPAAAPVDTAALDEALRALEKQLGRTGREQLKTNSIAEAQAAQLAAALEQLRAAEAQRSAELAALREQSRPALAAARLDVAQRMLPALDGLDAALHAGRQLLAGAQPPAAATQPTGGWLRRMLGEPPAPDTTADGLRQALAAWLHGLTFVQQRLLEALAHEGIRPIEAAGQPFDPQCHAVLGTVPASEQHPAGLVAEELRRGYQAGARVLRHAEVVVAMEDSA